jgi:hypothetical protein
MKLTICRRASGDADRLFTAAPILAVLAARGLVWAGISPQVALVALVMTPRRPLLYNWQYLETNSAM